MSRPARLALELAEAEAREDFDAAARYLVITPRGLRCGGTLPSYHP